MKKGFTSLLLAVTLIIITIGFSASASGVVSSEEQKMQQRLREELIKEKGEVFVENYEKATNVATNFMNEVPEDQYGGMWIDEDGNLHINIVNNSDTIKKAALSYDNVYIHEVKYTLKELNETIDKVEEFYALGKLDYNFASLSEKNNCINLDLPIEYKNSKKETMIEFIEEFESFDCLSITYSDNKIIAKNDEKIVSIEDLEYKLEFNNVSEYNEIQPKAATT